MCCKLMFFFWFGCGNAKIVPVTPQRNRNRSDSVAVFSCFDGIFVSLYV